VHRTLAQAISPDSAMGGRLDPYTTASMLRTKEQIVDLAPLTQFGARATPTSAPSRRRSGRA